MTKSCIHNKCWAKVRKHHPCCDKCMPHKDEENCEYCLEYTDRSVAGMGALAYRPSTLTLIKAGAINED